MLNSMSIGSAVQEQLQQAELRSQSVAANITITEICDFSLIQLATWADTLVEIENAALKIAAAETSPHFGQASIGENAALLRVEPLKYWLLQSSENQSATRFSENTVTKLLGVDTAKVCVLDLSHSRTWLRINGAQAETLLNHFLPIDLRETHFQINSLANTAFHHVGVTLWKSASGFELLLPRSFAATLTELLLESALQYG